MKVFARVAVRLICPTSLRSRRRHHLLDAVAAPNPLPGADLPLLSPSTLYRCFQQRLHLPIACRCLPSGYRGSQGHEGGQAVSFHASLSYSQTRGLIFGLPTVWSNATLAASSSNSFCTSASTLTRTSARSEVEGCSGRLSWSKIAQPRNRSPHHSLSLSTLLYVFPRSLSSLFPRLRSADSLALQSKCLEKGLVLYPGAGTVGQQYFLSLNSSS